MMGMKLREAGKTLPYFMKAGTKGIYLFDAWPASHDHVEKFVKAFNIDAVFFSSSQAREFFARRYSGCTLQWVPEGIDPNCYTYRPVGEKDIDVLQFGRKYEWHHSRIVGPLKRAGRKYIYRQGNEVTFRTKEELVDALARSKIAVLGTRDTIAPECTGGISTMTNRYLQAMASKVLVVGVVPSDMERAFGYIPIIEIDTRKPHKQILDILGEYDSFVPLIERNYQEILRHHRWSDRWRLIRDSLDLQ